MNKFNNLLEPNATQLNKVASNEAAQSYALTSIAISLKRISDFLERLTDAKR